MANLGKRKVSEPSETQSAAVNWIKAGAFVVILGVVIYSEFMFLSIIGVALPDGNNRYLAIIGAVATGMSVLILLAAKLWWVTPGNQLIWSWCFMGVEVAVMMLNDILGYQLHFGPVGPNLAWWQEFTPASPLLALVGWIMMLFLDVSQREKHADMDLAAKRAKKEREYTMAAFTSEMDLRNDHLDMVTEQLRDQIKSPEAQARIKNHAMRVVDRVLTDASGIVAGDYTPISQSGTPQIAPASQMSLAQEATIEPVEDKPNPVQRLLNVFKQPAQDDDDDHPDVYEQPVKHHSPATVESLSNDMQRQIHRTNALQARAMELLKARGMSEDEIEVEMAKFYEDQDAKK